jgi:hypothetical protein
MATALAVPAPVLEMTVGERHLLQSESHSSARTAGARSSAAARDMVAIRIIDASRQCRD